jgi:hypothetical protein
MRPSDPVDRHMRRSSVNQRLAIRTRSSERQRLASHLAATVSYLWVKALLTVVFGAMLGAGMITAPRAGLPRPARPPLRVPSV